MNGNSTQDNVMVSFFNLPATYLNYALPVVIRHPDARLPERAHSKDAGLDLSSVEDAVIPPGTRQLVDTGIAIRVPDGFAGLVVPRSGNALRGLTVANSPGVIDSQYTGNVKVILWNTTDDEFIVNKGDRIAQLLLVPVALGSVTEVAELEDTERGSGGFGSTGV